MHFIELRLSVNAVPSVVILGCRVHRVTMEQALAIAQQFLTHGGAHQIVTADASALAIAQQDRQLRDIINHADLVVPDSRGVVWAARRVGCPVPERVPGVDLMERLCELASQLGLGVYLHGAAPGVAQAAAANLAKAYPALNVVGTSHGYLSLDEESAVVEQIAQLRPAMLFVALGIPRQEKWISAHQPRIQAPIAVGVGGSFDCFSGQVRRAPEWFQKHGLEWAYRLACNPRKARKVAMLPGFVLKVIARGQRQPLQGA